MQNRAVLGSTAIAVSVAVALSGCAATATDSATGSTTASASAASSSGEPVGDQSLDVLLTNDDGWNAPGISALRAALQAAGHTVTVVAPSSDKSGTSASAKFGGSLTVTTPEPNVWAVDGTPADSVLFGLSTVLKDAPPDLVISGSNKGNNTGLGINYSGTVGAAITAAGLGIPAIAVSTDVPLGPEVAVEDFAPTADFVVQLVSSLPHERPVMDGTVINVNYPRGRAATDAKGVRFTDTSRTPFAEFVYQPDVPAGSYGIKVAVVPSDEDGTDTAAIADGMVAVSVLDVSRDPSGQESDPVAGIVDELHP